LLPGIEAATLHPSAHPLQAGDLGVPSTIGLSAGLPCRRLLAHGRLWMAERWVCLVPRCNSTFGDRSFVAAGPRVWDDLPTELRNTGQTIGTFCGQLKTVVFFCFMRLWRVCDNLIFMRRL